MYKTLLVGLDAAGWDYLDPMLQEGRLPTIERLMNSGTWGTLQSTLPPLTPVAWASIVTGKNPGKHGVYDMLWRNPETTDFSPTDARRRSGTPFWQRLNERGIRVGLVNVPFTYPIDLVDGFCVAGFGTPGSVQDITYPTNLLSWIKKNFEYYEPYVDPHLLKNAPPGEIFKAERDHQAVQVGIAAELSAKIPVDILVINLMLLDHANHLMPEMEMVQQAICELDDDLNKLIQAFQPSNVMVFSDHGSRRVVGDFLLHSWLRDQGYSVQFERTPAERDKALNWLLLQWFQGEFGWSGLSEKVARRIGRSILPFLPESLVRGFWRQLEESIPSAHKHMIFSGEVDINHSHVLMGGSYSGVLYLNFANDETSRIAQYQGKDRLLAELVASLSKIKDPDSGRSLFSNIYLSEEIYNGSATQFAPEIILDGYEAQWNILSTFRRGILDEKMHDGYFTANHRDFGHHSRDGIFIFSGQDFTDGPIDGEGHVMDIPATLLYLYNVPIPEDYDGRVMEDTFISDFIKQHPLSYQPGDEVTSKPLVGGYTDEESDELLAHLRALGYVD